MAEITRRTFFAATTGVAAIAITPAWLRSLAQSPENTHRLTTGWDFYQGSLDGPAQVWNSAELVTWQQVSLPHCVNHSDACDPDNPAYRGPAWYRTQLKRANPHPSGRTLLHFAGAGQTTDVYLGDSHLAQHIGGYDEWLVDITGHSSPQLAIRCDNSRDLSRMPSDLSDFTLYGGIYRSLTLVYVPEVSIASLHIHPTLSASRDEATITVTTRLLGTSPATTTIKLELLDAHSNLITEIPNKSLTLKHPLLWSPKNPHLYQCRATITTPSGTHTLTESFGIRSINFPENGLFQLNGERLFLRGTHRHEDHADFAAAMPDDLIRQELRLIKSMGANFIRLAHYQQYSLVLDLCDELGLIVWEELPWCRAGVGSTQFQQLGKNLLTVMIDEHFNHPSIVFWGLGNEDDWPTEFPPIDQPAIRAYLQQLNDLAHQLDPTRFTAARRIDFARDIPDVYSPSIWAGWYAGLYTEYQAALETQRKVTKRLLHIEWGADSHANRHAEDPDHALASLSAGHGTEEHGLAYLPTGGEARVSRDGDWSETYACDLFDWHLKTQESLPWLAGSAQWIFKDFTTPLRVENPIPRVNQKGLVERDLTPKEGFYVFQSYWAEIPMLHLYGHTWPIRWGKPGQPRLVRVYSNCPRAELFLNGISLGIRHRNSQAFPCAGLRWLTPFREGENHLRVVATTHTNQTLNDELTFVYQSTPWTRPAHFQLSKVSEKDNIITCRATVHDTAGVLCLDARTQIRFTLAGDAQLRDNQGTCTGSRVVQLQNGRAEISIRKIRGPITLAVSADALPTTLLTLLPK